MRRVILEFLELLDYMDIFVKRLCIGLTGTMALVVVMQVFFRYVIRSPLTWSEELSRYLLIWSAFLGGSSLVRSHENMYVDYFIEKLSPKVNYFLKLFLSIVTIAFLSCLLYFAVIVYPKVSIRQITPALQISMFYVQVSVIIGISLMVLQALNVFLSDLIRKERNDA